MVKSCGGAITQNSSKPETVCIGDSRSVHVASTIKRGESSIVRPSWIFDNIKQAGIDNDRPKLILPHEPQHMLHNKRESEAIIQDNVDEYNDSFARDIAFDELKMLMERMPSESEGGEWAKKIREELRDGHPEPGSLPGWRFHGLHIWPIHDVRHASLRPGGIGDSQMLEACQLARFGGAALDGLSLPGTTHVLVGDDRQQLKEIRAKISESKGRLPRIVTTAWVKESWQEKTLLDEERKIYLLYPLIASQS